VIGDFASPPKLGSRILCNYFQTGILQQQVITNGIDVCIHRRSAVTILILTLSKGWLTLYSILPMPSYENLYRNLEQTMQDSELMSWFVTAVMPIIQACNHFRENWRPSHFTQHQPPRYSKLSQMSTKHLLSFF